ncbi:hypothetical protein [Pararhizobium qamdonense]|uniref:hypothetical protein n=1 Tax=Pararhizobium qamdonense TaxID=3031126 RepID=UPI0023E2C1E5|nr:hypothetical protein [Pararhizobium qamdonense]
MPFTKIEQEAIILYAVLDMIDDMVNLAIFEKPIGDRDTNLFFKDSNARSLFAILLTDFLSQPRGERNKPLPFDLPRPALGARSSDKTYLLYLRQVCDDPLLASDPSGIADVINRFSDWLDGYTIVPQVWLSRISVELDIKIERMEFIKLCGNLSKHNFARLEADVRKLRRIVKNAGKDIDEGQAYTAIEDFKSWFNDDVFIYHSSTMGEFLNDLRYAIHRYLAIEYNRSRVPLPDGMYRFTYPQGVDNPLARELYWDLLNKIRHGIYFPPFRVSSSMKTEY